MDNKAIQALAAALWAGDDVDLSPLSPEDCARVEALLSLWTDRELRAAAAEADDGADGDDGDDGFGDDDGMGDDDGLSPWPWE